ncbi:MAG: hypothetical protein JW918_18725 [Anaerolineae bacterium]|jgi:hypothetical protein|nr:hypothetical protein [Anaerolineae bacterium]
MSQKKSAEVRLQIRLYAGQDDDLLHWLAQFDDRPYGAKSQAVKDALRRGIGISADVGQPPVTAAPTLDLAELRQVVEAAVDTALGRFEGQIGGGTRVKTSEEDDETEALLDDLEAALVLEDE